MRFSPILVTSVLILAGGCSSTMRSGPDHIRGTFTLAQIDGQTLPVDEGPIPHRFGGFTACNLLLDEGRLSLDPERGRYDLHYYKRSSCDGRALSESGQVGRYTQSGSELRFEIPSIDRPSAFRGTIRERDILIQHYDQQMVFRRPGLSGAPEVLGIFALRRAQNLSLPIPFGGNAGAGCPLMLDSGSLVLRPSPTAKTIFAPATGDFSLQHRLRDSCTGRIRHEFTEQGAYEQIVQAIYFEARVGPSTVHLYRGIVQSDGAIDIVFNGMQWHFTH